MKQLIKKHETKLRFLVVGGANTAIDFAILFILTALGLNKIVANVISTGVAFVFSFIANRQFTFKNGDANVRKQFILFTVVTLFGLWIIQPLIIWQVTGLIGDAIPSEQVVLFIAKILATVASLIWNYVFYSRIVFKHTEKK